MILSRSLAVIDLETTDADPATCAIFEYGLVVLRPDGTRKSGSMRFKPWKPITPEVEVLTGVTNDMVAACPPFSGFAHKIHASLQGKDLAGYNLSRFDLCCLDEELRRCSLKLSLDGVGVIDAYSIFVKKSPRDLSAAVKTYCGRDHEKAHSAKADAEATLDVLFGQLAAYEDLGAMSVEELAAFSRGDNEMVDLAGKLYRDKEGHMRFSFGAHRDQRIQDRAQYCSWMLSPKASFPGSTLDALSEELHRLGL